MQIDYQLLYEKVKDCLIHEVCLPEQAENVTHSLLLAEVCGIETHGLRMLADHIVRIRNGFYNINATISVEKETVCFTRVNFHGMIGMDSAVRCMQMAINKCKKDGIHIVFANNANTYSAAFIYTLMAAQQGLIGITMSNAPAKMPAYDGKQKLLGTNPISYAVPAKKNHPILFDMATSIVAQSKINMAKDRGEDIPLGWALDSNGIPTTDALKACKGLILPIAGPKGYGISLMVDLLAGLLSGAAYLDGVGRFYNENNECMNVGQLFVAIDPVQIYGEDFYNAIDKYIEKVRRSESLSGKAVTLPGERKFGKMAKAMSLGVQLSEEVIVNLDKIGVILDGISQN